MRRLLTSTALALLLAVPSLAAAQEDTLAKIKRTSAITIGFTETSAPFSFVGPGGTPQGYSIDLCLRIADGIKMVRRGDANFQPAVNRVLTRLYRSAEVVPIYEKWFGPFPEGGSLIAALYVLNSVPE
jgi:ABC-type amino acid transport substrate-binding protein